MKLPLIVLPVALAALSACSSQSNDAPANAGAPSAFGHALQLKDVLNPSSKQHAANGAVFALSGESFLWLDTFDETHDGKSVGTVYIEDADTAETGNSTPYSGTSLYEPSYVPASLRLTPGDIIDLPTATYAAESTIGTVTFQTGQFLIQISKPDVTFRFDSYVDPKPAVIDVNDLNDFDTGNQWNGMLVTIQNPTFRSNLENANGRVTAFLTLVNGTGAPVAGTVEMSNELFDVQGWNSAQADAGGSGGLIAQGKTITSLTGIVTWFEGYHIAPRYPADIVP